MPANSPAPKREHELEKTQVEDVPVAQAKIEEILNDSPATVSNESTSSQTVEIPPDTIAVSNAEAAVALLNEQVEEHHAQKHSEHTKFDKFKNQTKKEN